MFCLFATATWALEPPEPLPPPVPAPRVRATAAMDAMIGGFAGALVATPIGFQRCFDTYSTATPCEWSAGRGAAVPTGAAVGATFGALAGSRRAHPVRTTLITGLVAGAGAGLMILAQASGDDSAAVPYVAGAVILGFGPPVAAALSADPGR